MKEYFILIVLIELVLILKKNISLLSIGRHEKYYRQQLKDLKYKTIMFPALKKTHEQTILKLKFKNLKFIFKDIFLKILIIFGGFSIIKVLIKDLPYFTITFISFYFILIYVNARYIRRYVKWVWLMDYKRRLEN